MTKPAKLQRFEGAKSPARLVGIVYERQPDTTWRRYVCRRYADRSPYWSPTVLVDANLVYCMRCLSNRIMLAKDQQYVGKPPWFRCLDCSLTFSFLP